MRFFIFLTPIFLFTLLISTVTNAQNAPWVSYPSANQTAYGVYHFRKSFEIKEVPEKLIVHVSADNRYNLFVNGKRVCYGPAKGDLQTYKYDIIDIAPFLKKGKNQLAALVYNGGNDKPLSFFSVQTAFMLRTEDEKYHTINTSPDWKVYKNPAYDVISYQTMLFDNRWFYGFYACGGGDEVNAELYPWDWEKNDFNDNEWPAAELLVFYKKAPWNLVPRNIPFMANHLVYPQKIRNESGIDFPKEAWDGQTKIEIPANTKTTILIDFETFTMGYPELTVNRGKNSSIQINYAEALYEKVNLKAHRDSVENLTMYGVWDVFHPDGQKRIFRPLWKRTFRYVQLSIETGDEPLGILSYILEYSGYPYPEMAEFKCDNPKLDSIFEMSKRTLRMCSAETYYDTPYYEQMSYGGDNRPITAISTYNSNDDRLLREMLRLYSQSENKETGLYKSAYPSRFDFDNGTWSMAWVQTLHDYYFLRGDSAFIVQFGKKIERVLEYYERHLDERTGLIGTVNNRSFIDWSITKGKLPRTNDKNEIIQSALLSLFYAHTVDCAVTLWEELEYTKKAEYWNAVAQKIKDAVAVKYWNEEYQLFSEHPDSAEFTHHTNIFAILCDLVAPVEQSDLMLRILEFEGFEEIASSYFSFFLFKAMEKTGHENRYLENIDFWYDFIDRGLTTCGETGFASHDRSDCHAWSAHPAYYLLSSVCGIKSADIGFNKVKIKPHLGDLKNVKANMPHLKGRIEVEYKKVNDKLESKILLPKGMTGTFEYNEKTIVLKEGENLLEFNKLN